MIYIEKYLSDEECDVLANWTLDAAKNGQLQRGRLYLDPKSVPLRLTTRYDRAHTLKTPQLALDIQKRLVEKFPRLKGLRPCMDQGIDGIITNVTLPGGRVAVHIDPSDTATNNHLVRVNIMVTDYEGGDMEFDGKVYHLRKGDLIFFCPTKVEHEVFPVILGERVLWMWTWVSNKKCSVDLRTDPGYRVRRA